MLTYPIRLRPIVFILLTVVLVLSAALSSISSLHAQEGLLPLPGVVTRGFTEDQVLTPPSSGYSLYGYGVAAEGDLLAFGARLADAKQTKVVLVFHRGNAGIWTQEAQLILPEAVAYGGGPGGYIGTSSQALSGNTLMIGDSCTSRGFDGECYGTVYFYERSSIGVWSQVGEESVGAGEGAGGTVTLDGDLAATFYETYQDSEVATFARDSGGAWDQDDTLFPGESESFTSDIDLNGNRLAIAAGSSYTGDDFISIFERGAGVWNRPASATLFPTAGDSVQTVELDGDTLFAQILTFGNPRTSHVEVFHYSGGNWTYQQTLVPDTPNGSFGTSLAAEGNLLAIGNPNDTNQSGAVYLFRWNGTSWSRLDKITDASAAFGWGVALSNLTLFVGPRFDSLDSVHIYTVNDQPSTTPEPTQDPSTPVTGVPPTLTPTPTAPSGTSEPTPDATSDVTLTPTPPTPTSTSNVDGQVLSDGGFEQQLLGWSVDHPTGDKVQCNTAEKLSAYEGFCAFLFKGKLGENARLAQTVVITGRLAGNALTLSGFVKAKGSNINSKVKVVVHYADSLTPKSTIKININKGTGGFYLPFSTFQPSTTLGMTSLPKMVKFTIRNKGEKGKVWFDSLSLMAHN